MTQWHGVRAWARSDGRPTSTDIIARTLAKGPATTEWIAGQVARHLRRRPEAVVQSVKSRMTKLAASGAVVRHKVLPSGKVVWALPDKDSRR